MGYVPRISAVNVASPSSRLYVKTTSQMENTCLSLVRGKMTVGNSPASNSIRYVTVWISLRELSFTAFPFL